MPRLKNDMVELFSATHNKQLDKIKVETDPRAAATVVAVSGGYPGHFEKGYEITGLSQHSNGESLVFHAATRKADDLVITNGGRVLCVTSYGDTIADAVSRSKAVLGSLYFEDIYYRNDIGFEFNV